MLKRILLLLVVGVMIFTLAACGSETPKQGGNSGAESPGNGEQQQGEEDLSEFEKIQRQESEGSTTFEYILQEGGTVEGSFSIKVEDNIFTEQDAQKLTVYSAEVVTWTNVESHAHTYVGYKLLDVLELYGLTVDGDFYVVADDGYKITCRANSLDENTMIALSRDEKTNNAPIYAPCSSQLSPNYVTGFAELRLE